MKFYDYKCSNCGNVKEYYEHIEDNKYEHTCANCNTPMQRVILQAPSFNFKKYPKGHNLNATQRKELWDSDNINDLRKII